MRWTWNYLPRIEDGQKLVEIALECSPGDWPDIRAGLGNDQPWDEQGVHQEVHDPAGWRTTRLGSQLLAVSPSFPVLAFPRVANARPGAGLVEADDDLRDSVGGR